MSRTSRTRHHNRTLAVAAGLAAGAVLFAASPASAHVEIESENAQALAENVTLAFEAESESGTAGITELRVVLPEGIAPADVVYGEGPKGWKFTANDDGYTVQGPAVKVGENAEYSVVVKQLPDAKELAFKTLQTYSDKRVDRWIELGEGSKSPAPVLVLKAAAPDAKPASASPSPSVSASPSEPVEEPSPSPAAVASQDKDDDGGLGAGAWIGIGAGLIVLAGGAVYLVRRRASAQQ